MTDLTAWTPRPRPQRAPLDGRYVRLEPLDAVLHGDDLFAAGSGDDAPAIWRYLSEHPITLRSDFDLWIDKAAASPDPLFFAAIDKQTGRAEGRVALMRIDPVHGVIETGNILFGPRLSRSRAATEAIYLQARHIFEDLGYRRFEWKCNADNTPSRRAALRFGFSFEGIFRQHMVVKGENRDTAWYAMLDHEWPRLKQAYDAWLDPANFDENDRQRTPLAAAGAT